ATGLDMGTEPLQVARLHALESALKINYIQSTVEDHAETHPEQYDVITCMEMLEHVPDPASIISACASLLKPGGVLFASTMTRTPQSWLLAIFMTEYVMKMLPRGTHDFNRFIRPSELLHWADQNELICDNISGFHYNPLSNHFSVNQRISANYILCLRKPMPQPNK
ncbi:MAG: bifunctional 2-polyprenyl-6-hydroxyphenol methylase/3-demethylubiquinol 3-O-methyltransferase UbiG, partial [Enterobacteriaceae bacterium]